MTTFIVAFTANAEPFFSHHVATCEFIELDVDGNEVYAMTTERPSALATDLDCNDAVVSYREL